MSLPRKLHFVLRSLPLPRRLLQTALLLLGLMAAIESAAATAHCTPGNAPTIATMNWMLLETLIALDAAPAGAAQLQTFDRWVGTADPPASVNELGLRSQPNLALLSQIDPDRILLSRRFISLKSRLSQIAPVFVVGSYLRPGRVWPNLLAATRRAAALACRQAAGQRLIQNTMQKLARLKQRLPADTRPLLVLQFVDQKHVRVFGPGSLYHAVLNQLGLSNAWDGATNAWGYALVGIGALLQRDLRDARIIVVEPPPAGLRAQLANNGLWQHLPAVRRDRVLQIPAVWSFGGLPSAQRFARLITQALKQPGKHAFQNGRADA